MSDSTTSSSSALTIPDFWRILRRAEPDQRHLERRHIISVLRRDPAHAAFDVLRTRTMQAMEARQWTRIGVTSPTAKCGKTLVAVNLAFSQARRIDTRTLLMDMNLRRPQVASVLGLTQPADMVNYLHGHVPPEDFIWRIGENLAVGLNTVPSPDAAEVLHATMTADVLEEAQDLLMPDLTIFDLPSMQDGDDVLSFLPSLDAVLLIVGGGTSTEEEITQAETLLEGQVPILGVVLNRAQE